MHSQHYDSNTPPFVFRQRNRENFIFLWDGPIKTGLPTQAGDALHRGWHRGGNKEDSGDILGR
jgi:hypothetical protein